MVDSKDVYWFIPDGINIEAKTKQMKKKRKQMKRKGNLKVYISERDTHRSKQDTATIPQGVESSDQRLNNNEYGEFDDQEYHHIKITSISSYTSPCII